MRITYQTMTKYVRVFGNGSHIGNIKYFQPNRENIIPGWCFVLMDGMKHQIFASIPDVKDHIEQLYKDK